MSTRTQLQVAQSILDEYKPGHTAESVTIGPLPMEVTIHTDRGDVGVTGLFAAQIIRAEP